MIAALVFVGGGMGALARYAVSALLPQAANGFPWATLAVNLSGALLIGVLVRTLPDSAAWRAFVLVGLLGGFTTFSTLSLETLHLLQNRELGLASAYILLSVGAGVLACWVGTRGHA